MRRYEFDNLKGIMIFFVVLGHLTTLSAQETDFCSISCMNTIINSFHMPVFAFVSGLFSKKQIDENQVKNTIEAIEKGTDSHVTKPHSNVKLDCFARVIKLSFVLFTLLNLL